MLFRTDGRETQVDKQRMQVDWNLLGQLLRCETLVEVDHLIVESGVGEKEIIVLIDLGRIQLEPQGNAAMIEQLDRSIALVMALMEGRSIGDRRQGTASVMGDAAGFLVEILQLIGRTQGDPAKVYAFFRMNVGRLDESLLQVLSVKFTHLIQHNNPSEISTVFIRFGNLVQQFPLGNRMLNLELGITAYQQALTVMTKESMPIEWATTTINLSIIYCSRIKGDRADNIEQAINGYQKALTVITQATMPIEWAQTTNNLATAYKDRIKGDRVDNVEQAINGYQKALTVMTKESMPIEWALTTMNLATAYKDRIKGDRADNIEQAIAAHQIALTMITKADMPFQWAQTTMNLAIAYMNRIKGDRADNIEQAISGYQKALTVTTEAAMPFEWLQTTNHLANAYYSRIKGDRGDNIEQAITAYKKTLIAGTEVSSPIDWANSNINLAVAYSNRIRGDRDENIEMTINAYNEALSVVTVASMPIEWAQTTNNLANAYRERIKGDRADNIEQAIYRYQKALTVMTVASMPIEWAQTTYNLANAYYSRIKGDRSENIERAIDTYKQVFTVRTKESTPVDWAQTTSNLAIAYSDRIKGNRTENIEQAIASYEQALTVMTKAAMPVDWAQITMNLANAYSDRIKGDRAENIEQAIASYEQVWIVMTKESMPIEWAKTTINLATAYSNRIKGDRAENVERAIDFYEAALIMIMKESMPFEWAKTTMNLATAYSNRIKGDCAGNIEQAINGYQQALTVMTKESIPIEWAQTTMNLALAYSNRIKGDRAENIEQAINGHQQALTIMTENSIPIDWAQTTNNLAIAYYYRIKGDRAENIEQAINRYQKALTVMTETAMPIDWAQITNNLANAYRDRLQGNHVENIEQAIKAYEQSLTVTTKAAMPIQWATTTMNLATTYKNRIQGNRAENIEQAITSYQQALTVMTLVLPDDCRRTSRLLSNLYSDQTRWTEAASTYTLALQAAEICYQRSDFLDSKSSELSTTADLHRRAAYAYAQTGDLKKAIVTLEQGRARGLSESLSRDRANLIQLSETHPDLYSEYKKITTQLRNLEIEQRNPDSSRTRQEIQTSSQTLDQQLQDAIKEIRQIPNYEDFLMPIKWEGIEKTLSLNNPLIYIVTTPNDSMALIATNDAVMQCRESRIELLPLDQLNETILREILYGPADEKELGRYLGTYQDALNDFKANSQSWCNEIESTTRDLWDLLMGPIVQHLKLKGYDRATLIPTGYLSLLPLHAAWTPDPDRPTGKRYAIDDIHFTYTPNARSLTESRKIADRPFTDSILAIDDPSHGLPNISSLPNSQREIDCAIDSFSDRTVLRHGNATIDAVKSGLSEAAIVHFSCHGTANFTEPLNSGLLMSDGLLTLKDLLALNLAQDSGIRLAILSACETGLPGLDNIDEVVSLPIGLLQAGVAGVISSLWSVDAASTMMLLTRFYDLWRKDGLEPAIALHQAQQWMHSTTDGEKADYCGFLTLTPDEYTYAHPFHWAAFSYLGV